MFIPPSILLLIAIALSYLVSILFPDLGYYGLNVSLLGLTSITLGAILFVWSLNTLRRHKTAIHMRHKPTRLVTRGPYAYTRNPMYVGFLLVTVGTALLFANVLAFIGPILFFAFATMFIIPFEEAVLSRKFGKPYHSYRKKTRKWV